MKHYHHNGLAGCVATRRNRFTGLPVSVYNAEQAGMGEGWVTVCETHGQLIQHDSLSQAMTHMAVPEWCEFCQTNVIAKVKS